MNVTKKIAKRHLSLWKAKPDFTSDLSCSFVKSTTTQFDMLVMWVAMRSSQDVKEHLKSKPLSLTFWLVLVYLLLLSTMNSQMYILFINWKKSVQSLKWFGFLFFFSLGGFKQQIRCDQKTQCFSEKSSGRCSPEGGLCRSVKILSRRLKAASHGLD